MSFEDRGTPHTAEESLEVAIELGIEVRLLPRATPELNAMDHLWRHIKVVLCLTVKQGQLTSQPIKHVSIFLT